jgi:hypothetical protein
LLATALIASVWLAASPAEAGGGSGPGIEAGGYIFRGNFDNESNIENDEGLGGRFGILFTPEHELELSLDYVATHDDFGAGLDVDLTTFKIGYVYNFAPGGAVSPLFTVGGGWQNVQVSEPDLFGSSVLTDDTDPMAFAGFGVRFFIGSVFNIRVDGLAHAVFPNGDVDDTLVDGILSAGVGWMIGRR